MKAGSQCRKCARFAQNWPRDKWFQHCSGAPDSVALVCDFYAYVFASQLKATERRNQELKGVVSDGRID